MVIPDHIRRLALEKNDDDPFSEEEIAICEEYTSGQALENMKFDRNDPQLLDYLLLYKKWQKKTTAVIENFRAIYLNQTPALQLPVISQKQYSIRKTIWLSVSVAAVAAAICFSVVFYNNVDRTKANNIPAENNQASSHDIEPGGNKAVLTLANGTQINLDYKSTETIPQQGTATVQKQGDGLVYMVSGNDLRTKMNNTLATPTGGQYKITLADGTRVWLNAQTTLHYPVVFSGNERHVELNGGEAYFEVAPNPKKPFFVTINSTTRLRVIGTRFNVKAYTTPIDNSVTTTLLEGSVKLQDGKTLNPNQQAIVAGNTITIRKVTNIDQILAWKNGYINLEGETVSSILNQISRWYNVQTNIIGNPKISLKGKFPKKFNMEQVLDALNVGSQTQFTLEKNTLTARAK